MLILRVGLVCVAMLGTLRPQGPVPAECNRVFAQSTTGVAAIELDGTIAWLISYGSPGGVELPSGIAFDGNGYIWQTTAFPMLAPLTHVRKFTTAGALVFAVPTGDPLGSIITGPSTDRLGNCYFGRQVPATGMAGGIVNRLTKMGPGGVVLWDLDLTTVLALSTPPNGQISEVKVDEDGNIWAVLADLVTRGGRVIKVDPAGNVLFSMQAEGESLSMDPQRTVRVLRTRIATSSWCIRCAVTLGLDGTFIREDGFNLFPGQFLDHASGLVYWHVFGAHLTSYAQGYLPTPPPLGYQALASGNAGLGLGYSGILTAAGVVLDPLGRLWCGGTVFGAPCAVRFDPATPSLWYPVATITPVGFSHPTSWYWTNTSTKWTAYTWCLTVDPWGDLDGDGVMNRNEIMEGTNPCDPLSHGSQVVITGFALGQTGTITLSAPGQPGAPYATWIDIAPSVLRLGDHRGAAPDPLGIIPQWWWAPANPLVSGACGVLDGSGSASISVQIPNDPALNGLPLSFGSATGDVTWSLGVRSIFGPMSFQLAGAGP